MTQVQRAVAALGLGIMLLAAGKAPNIGPDLAMVNLAVVSSAASVTDRLALASYSPLASSSPASASTPSVFGPANRPLPAQAELRSAPDVVEAFALENGLDANAVAAADTLAEAVQHIRAANAVAMDEDMKCLATAVYFESKGEPLAGQLAVAEVILNRVEAGRFGDSICDVVKAPKQFSFVRNGHIGTPRHQKAYETAQAIAWIAQNNAWNTVVGAATHFHATRVSPGWRLQRVATVGNHIFYR